MNEESICPYCFYRTALRDACPNCGETFPLRVGALAPRFFSIVGATESGKSHYIAVMIERMKAAALSFGWSFHAFNDETTSLYEQNFRKPLYEDQVTLQKTQFNSTGRPLIYALNLRRGNAVHSAMLVFFDMAGEHFTDESLERAKRYIVNSSGILFLIDPLQFETMRELFQEKFADADQMLPNRPDDRSRSGDMFARMTNMLRDANAAQPNRAPVALTFSKIDAIRFWLTDDSPLFKPSLHRGAFSISEYRRINDHCRNILARLDARNEIIQVANDPSVYPKLAFFGVSALGQNPQATQKLRFQPRPIRPLDPILWLLWMNGLIPSIP